MPDAVEKPRFIIGIDLGTSNTALSFLDTLEKPGELQTLLLPQFVTQSVVENLPLIPSVLYLATEEEVTNKVFESPFDSYALDSRQVLGTFAKQEAIRRPGRVIQSAKSWLAFAGVNRTSAILPWATEDIIAEEKLSPVRVSATILAYLKGLWNATIAKFEPTYQLEFQDVIITVPASFDEVAQRLTREAALQAGYPETTRLLEEPQAALYSWLHSIRNAPADHTVKLDAEVPEQSILVCDVGGGTSDFSLFKVRAEALASFEIERIAVSEHLLLGGDNIDLALARFMETRFDLSLHPLQFATLVQRMRELKEEILFAAPKEMPETIRIELAGTGSRLFAKTFSAEAETETLQRLILDGFFPLCSADERVSLEESGIREWGLPFASDPRISVQLNAFLQGRRVDAVLFNGGTLRSAKIRERLIEAIVALQDGAQVRELHFDQQQLAVARGAAYYGALRYESRGIIHAGYARSLYLGASDKRRTEEALICILPKGHTGTSKLSLSQRKFTVLIGTPVQFSLYSSTTRSDQLGDKMPLAAQTELWALPPLQTVIQGDATEKGKRVEVELLVYLDELGMLHLTARELSGTREWELEFNIKQLDNIASAREVAEEGEISVEVTRARAVLDSVFGSDVSKKDLIEPKYVMRELEKILGSRAEWSLPTLRGLWPNLEKGNTRRGRSLAHEVQWLTLAGIFLRPGVGHPLDEFYIEQLWRLRTLGLKFQNDKNSEVQLWVLWRRVSAGLSEERQAQLFAELWPRATKKKESEPELIRLLGALERISGADKERLFKHLVAELSGRKTSGIEHFIWAMSRVASREPLFGSAHQVLLSTVVEQSLEPLLSLDWNIGDRKRLAGAMVAIGRVTGDRQRDLSPEFRQTLVRKIKPYLPQERLLALLEFIPLQEAEKNQLFGEKLPLGLQIVS